MSHSLQVAVAHALSDELDAAFGRIKHCVRQLTDDQVWWRPRPEMNPIGNLLLHLCGNVKQFIVSVIGGEPDDRDRASEFTSREAIPGPELVRRLESVVERARVVIAASSEDELCRVRAVRTENWSGIQTIVRSVAHFRGHTQEIIHVTRMILADRYEYAGLK
jgi:hypothetical protein